MHKTTRIAKTKEETTAPIFWKLEADGCVVMDLADVRSKTVYVTESLKVPGIGGNRYPRSWRERRLRSSVLLGSCSRSTYIFETDPLPVLGRCLEIPSGDDEERVCQLRDMGTIAQDQDTTPERGD